jgi:catechol 2,3-dioxygenase-like lactoylglutathione lyase family enzyme
MLESYDLVAFVLTGDAPRAKTFYGETLGLKFVSQDDYAVVFDAKGLTLRVTTIPGHTPTEHTVLGWNVPDIALAAADLVKAGVKFEKYSFLEQDEFGIWSSPNGAAKVAWFKDPDGNVLSISQH